MSYSQSNEEEIILKYFGDNIFGNCLSIGENSGIHLSNVRALIIGGFSATLVEPAPEAFNQLDNLYIDRDDVQCINAAVSHYVGKAKLYDSGTHLNKGDKSLLSSLHREEIKKWEPTTKFEEIIVDVIDWETLYQKSIHKTFDFISIDAEGSDLTILHQMDLRQLETQLICLEHNSVKDIKKAMITYCKIFGLNNVLLENAENIIISK